LLAQVAATPKTAEPVSFSQVLLWQDLAADLPLAKLEALTVMDEAAAMLVAAAVQEAMPLTGPAALALADIPTAAEMLMNLLQIQAAVPPAGVITRRHTERAPAAELDFRD
jgi:hypothetical protein